MLGQWKFDMTAGTITRPDGLVAALGYSGHGEGLDNPAKENVKMVGPLPEGRYRIGELEEEHGKLGPHVRSLMPLVGTNVFGRSGFYIHGDNQEQDHSASEGCLVPWKLIGTGYDTLRKVRNDMEGTLLVVA